MADYGSGVISAVWQHACALDVVHEVDLVRQPSVSETACCPCRVCAVLHNMFEPAYACQCCLHGVKSCNVSLLAQARPVSAISGVACCLTTQVMSAGCVSALQPCSANNMLHFAVVHRVDRTDIPFVTGRSVSQCLLALVIGDSLMD